MLVLAVACCGIARADAPTGAVYVVTLPSAADVWLDGAYIGRTPVLVDALTAGRHSVTAAKNGWASKVSDVAIAAGGIAFATILLDHGAKASRAGGTIGLRGRPVEALELDGTAVVPGPDGTLAATAGIHELMIRAGGARMTRRVVVYPDVMTAVVVGGGAAEEDPHAGVVAPAARYLPAGAYAIEGRKVVVHYNGHDAIGELDGATIRIDGEPATFRAAPTVIAGRLYLPMELLIRMGATPVRMR